MRTPPRSIVGQPDVPRRSRVAGFGLLLSAISLASMVGAATAVPAFNHPQGAVGADGIISESGQRTFLPIAMQDRPEASPTLTSTPPDCNGPGRNYVELGSSAEWRSDEADHTFSIAWAGVDGDGDLDLAVGNWGPNRVYVNEGGRLAERAAWSSAEEDDTRSVAWGDVDGDGDLDRVANATIGIRKPLTLGSVSLASTNPSTALSLYGSSYAAAVNIFTNITTTGDQTYNGVVSIGRGSSTSFGTTLTTTGGGSITLAGGVVSGLPGYWAAGNLTLDTSAGNGNITLAGTGKAYGVGNLNATSGTDGLIFSTAIPQTVSVNIAGTAGLTELGPGVPTLAGSNTYTDPTVVNGATSVVTPLPEGLRIMPLGDSITYGYPGSNAGYRGYLYNLLNPVATNWQFIGVSQLNPGSLPDNPLNQRGHNGYSSYATLDLASNLDGLDSSVYNYYGGAQRNPNGGYWLTGGGGTGRGAVHPDVVLLMVGANDISQGGQINPLVTVANYQANLTSLLNELLFLEPNVRVLLATIIPWAAQSANVATINSGINTVACSLQAQGKRVTVVDLNTAFPANGLSGDGVHPNDTGYTFMASQWYDAILGAYGALAGQRTYLPIAMLDRPEASPTLELPRFRGHCGSNVLRGQGK